MLLMQPVRADHKVKFLPERVIKSMAESARRILRISSASIFNVADCFRFLERNDPFGLGIIKVIFHSEGDFKEPAYVDIGTTRILHIKTLVWEDMDEGVPHGREVGGHELGHLALHDCWAQPFSGQKAKWINFEEESAEWQADKFASHFLITDENVENLIAPRFIAIGCGVPVGVARRKIGSRFSFTGDCCSKCGNFTLVRGQYNMRCDTCGKYS